MVITKYESYYNKIVEKLEVIKTEQSYANLSLAFAHWFLENQYEMSEQEVAESIIDGDGDNGIDAIIHNAENKSLEVFQFKFPSSVKTLNDEIKQGDILKTLNGFNILVEPSNNVSVEQSNSSFKDFKESLNDAEIQYFRINFVSFNKGIVAEANREQINNFLSIFRSNTGAKIDVEYFSKNEISNIYEKIQRNTSLEVKIPFKTMQPAYSNNGIISSVGVINAKALVESIKDVIGVIFDENVRLLETNSSVNNGIKKTASSEEASMFYLYNNGITFICDGFIQSPTSQLLTIVGASIVNGCQTVTSLYQLNEENKLSEDVDILTRIIEISDYEQRSKITEFLNSQNPVKNSYFIANNSIVRDLQTALLEHNYFLERQINEAKHKAKYVDSDIIKNKAIIKLENVIQYYTGYYINKHAALAKRQKGGLYSQDIINEILMHMTAEKVIESYTMYEEIAKVITSYRKNRRNKNNSEFADFMGINNEEFVKLSDDYLFINTADILLLNIVGNLKNKNQQDSNQELIKKAIDLLKNTIDSNEEYHKTLPSSITKNQKIYSEIQMKILN